MTGFKIISWLACIQGIEGNSRVTTEDAYVTITASTAKFPPYSSHHPRKRRQRLEHLQRGA